MSVRMGDGAFLPGVPQDFVLDRLARAPGDELRTKFSSEDSSSALAVNAIGWFVPRKHMFPGLPGLNPDPVSAIEIEYEARLPWTGGTHPHLDAAIITSSQLVGIESKRFEPFRTPKSYILSEAYDRDRWSPDMASYKLLCRLLRDGNLRFEYLDATQLVKHALGLASHGSRLNLRPALVYLYSEPRVLRGRPIDETFLLRHREEVEKFAGLVRGAGVPFHAMSYRDWIATWDRGTPDLAAHADAVLAKFQP